MNWNQIMDFFWMLGVPVLLILGVTLWVFRPGSRKRYEQDAQIPFGDEESRNEDRDNPRK
jgi:cbb3-type cytochrome oxidase subunit 3